MQNNIIELIDEVEQLLSEATEVDEELEIKTESIS